MILPWDIRPLEMWSLCFSLVMPSAVSWQEGCQPDSQPWPCSKTSIQPLYVFAAHHLVVSIFCSTRLQDCGLQSGRVWPWWRSGDSSDRPVLTSSHHASADRDGAALHISNKWEATPPAQRTTPVRGFFFFYSTDHSANFIRHFSFKGALCFNNGHISGVV